MLVTQPAGAAAASGSMGGSTASRNRFGAYMRTKAIPVQPNSAAQASAKSRFALASAAWTALTAAVKASWETYAGANPVNNALGVPVYPTGRNRFMGSYALRNQAGLSPVTTAITVFTQPSMTQPVLTVAPGSSGSLVFTPTDGWDVAGGGLMLWVSEPKSPDVNFCKGPYQYAGKVAGAGTPGTSPATIALPYTYAAGQKVYYKCTGLSADGRTTATYEGFCTVSA
jgi:hypothetical protein